MEQSEKIIESLKQDLENREKDIYLAASLGKQLLREKGELCKKQEELLSQMEALKQENHSLQLNVDAKEQMIKAQVVELETLKEDLETVSQCYKQCKKDDTLRTKNYQDLIKENSDLKTAHEDLMSTCSELKKQVQLLQDQVEDYQDQMNQSLNETLYAEEYLKLQNELRSTSEEKINIELCLHAAQYELDQMKNKEAKYIKRIKEMEEEIDDKDKEISTYSVLIEKSKEEVVELQGEIEMLKLMQVDVNRRGNSVFGELDDRRLEVEKRYIELRDKYKSREEQFVENLVALRRTKNQLAAALASLSLQNAGAAYIEQLENHLYSSKREIRDLTDRLMKAEEKLRQPPKSPDLKMLNPQKNTYDYLKALLQLSEKRVKTLEEDLSEVRRQKVMDNSKLLETENSLYFAEKNAATHRTQALKLKLQVEELQAKDKENVICAPKEEMIPGFVKKSEKPKQECHKDEETSTESRPSMPSPILASVIAKLNTSQNDNGFNTQANLSNDSSTLYSRDKNERVPVQSTRKVTRTDIASDTSCIQQ